MANLEKTKYLNIVNDIKTKINRGIYKPGARLPGQFALAKEYDVSAITSNRALQELQAEGFVERRPRSGSFVTDKNHYLKSVTVLLFESPKGINLEAQEYSKGILDRAQELKIPTRIINSPDPLFREQLAKKEEKQGFILINHESEEVVRQIKEAYAYCVVTGQRAKHCGFSVLEDCYNAGRELTSAMIADGCRKLAFIGILERANHRLSQDGFLEVIRQKGLKPLTCINSNDKDEHDIVEAVYSLLTSDNPPDGLIIMGGLLPIPALPLIFSAEHKVQLGLFSENPLINRLKGSVYMAEYSQYEVGRMAFDLLCDASQGKASPITVKYPPLKITRPNPKITGFMYH